MKKLVLNLIKLYQKTEFFRAPFFKTFFLSDASCRYSPTCSRYTYQAVEKYGVMKGIYIGIKRIVRCHPWTKGGYDPVP